MENQLLVWFVFYGIAATPSTHDENLRSDENIEAEHLNQLIGMLINSHCFSAKRLRIILSHSAVKASIGSQRQQYNYESETINWLEMCHVQLGLRQVS